MHECVVCLYACAMVDRPICLCRRRQLDSAESDEDTPVSPDFVRGRLDQLA